MSFGRGSPSLKVEGHGAEVRRGVAGLAMLLAVFRRGIAGERKDMSNIKGDRVRIGEMGVL